MADTSPWWGNVTPELMTTMHPELAPRRAALLREAGIATRRRNNMGGAARAFRAPPCPNSSRTSHMTNLPESRMACEFLDRARDRGGSPYHLALCSPRSGCRTYQQAAVIWSLSSPFALILDGRLPMRRIRSILAALGNRRSALGGVQQQCARDQIWIIESNFQLRGG